MCEPHCYVFGYGSLVHLEKLRSFLGRPELDPSTYHYCSLEGYKRTWNVAMHNLTDIPGYKCYLDPESSDRPDLHVTFLNICEASDSSLNGIAFQVSEVEFERICVRERNYDPIDVSNHLDTELPLSTVAFIAKPEAIELHATGCSAGTSVICAEYHQTVEESFRSLGPEAWSTYQKSTEPIQIPIQNLVTRRIPFE